MTAKIIRGYKEDQNKESKVNRMHMDEELLQQMNQIRQDDETVTAKVNFEQKIIDSVQTGSLELEDQVIEFDERILFEEQVKLRIPKTFSIMDPELASLKYPSARRPEPIYSNGSGSINIAFNHTESKVTDEEIPDFKNFMRRNLKKMQPGVRFLSEGVKLIHEKTVGYFDFMSPAVDTELYNMVFFVQLRGRALMGTFNCPEKEMKLWQPIAKGMLESLTILQ
jgi:hypothetical protein